MTNQQQEREAHTQVFGVTGAHGDDCPGCKAWVERMHAFSNAEGGASGQRWRGNTPAEQAIYEHFMDGGTRGDLYVNVRRGRLGIMKPDRAHGHAFAAWMAGQALALQGPDQ